MVKIDSHYVLLSSVLSSMFVLGACSSVITSSNSFENTEWKLSELNIHNEEQEIVSTQNAAIDLTMSFTNDQIGVRIGCIEFGGKYSYSKIGNRFLVKEFVIPTIECVQTSDTQDNSPLKYKHRDFALQTIISAKKFAFEEDSQLILSDEYRSLVFTAVQ